MKKTVLTLAVAAMVCCGLAVQNASATPSLTLSVNGGPATSAFTTTLGPGQFGIQSTTVGSGFSLVISGAQTSLGGVPNMDLAGLISYTGHTPATITLCLTGDMFTSTGSLLAQLGGTMTPGMGSISSVVEENGVVLGSIPSTGSFNTTPFGGTAHLTPFSPVPFSLMDCVTISFTGPGTISFDSQITPGVPDGGMTVALLGIGLVGLGAVSRLHGRVKI